MCCSMADGCGPHIHLADKMSHGVCGNLTVAKKHLYPLTNTHVSIWPVVSLTGQWPYLIFNVRRVLQLCPHSLPLFNNFVWFSVYRDSVSCHLYPSGLPHLCQYTACGMFTRPNGAHPEWFEWESGGHSWGALKTHFFLSAHSKALTVLSFGVRAQLKDF